MSGSFLSSVNFSQNYEQQNKKYYFMSGLPRSGSTLLSSILNQNPLFYSAPSSPVLPMMYVLEEHLQSNELYNAFPKPQEATKIISNIINYYYSDIQKPIVFDKNRAWPARIPFIEIYIEKSAKILCPVRDVDEILSSVINMIRRNPYKEGAERLNFVDVNLVKSNMSITDDNRCKIFMDGILRESLQSFDVAKVNGFLDRLHFIEYKDLVENPDHTMKKIYNFLGEDYFKHTFKNFKNIYRENDLEVYGLADMHEVHKTLKKDFANPKDILSKEILETARGLNIWRDYK